MNSPAPSPVIGLKLQDPLAARIILEALKMDGHPDAASLAEGGPPDNCRLVISDDAPGPWLDICHGRGIQLIQIGEKIRLGEILAQVRRCLDDRSRALSGVLTFASYRLDLSGLVLTHADDGRKVILTEKERDILVRLHGEQGLILDRKTLLEDVWGYGSTIETHTLETHIYRLRQKLEADPAKPDILVTEGNGYRLALI